MIQETSQLSLLDTIKEGKVNNRHQQILALFKDYQYLNNREIGELLNLPINSITPRCNELVKMRYLKEFKKDKDRVTNRKTIYWGLVK